MGKTVESIVAALDRGAQASGVLKLAERAAGPARPLRILPWGLLIMVGGGVALVVANHTYFGYFSIIIAWVATSQANLIGPLRLRRNCRGRDEREIELTRSAHFVGLGVISALAVAGCIYFGLAQTSDLGLPHLWFPHHPIAWLALAFSLMAVELNVALLAASRHFPKSMDDET